MRIAVCGHVDAGKSTTIGRILYDTESLPDSKISEVQALVNEFKRRFEFAYFLDSFREELEEEKTIDTTRVIFKYKDKEYEIVDVPGHKEYIRNMLTGASNADLAVLIIDAVEGIQEQTKRHCYLLKLLGVSNVVLVINKMDLVDYDYNKYIEVSARVSEMLRDYGLWAVGWLAASAINGDNIVNQSKNMEYSPPLLDVLDGYTQTVTEKKDDTLRIVVQGRYNGLAMARVITGTWKGGAINHIPIDSFTRLGTKVDKAEAGDCIELNLSNRYAHRGSLLLDEVKRVEQYVTGEAVLVDGELEEGDKILLATGALKHYAKVSCIKNIVDTESGAGLGKDRKIKEGQAGIIQFRIKEGCYLESFKTCEALGRFVVYKHREPIGLGIVL